MNAPNDSSGESRGLEFLRQVRPDAIAHLLAFFSESARHLDPRTRFLISVVTKVISGSKRGVRQYVRRALENGATPDEVLDAVLCAYPCAGLTKVVDAVDVILAMNLPGLTFPVEEKAERPPPPPSPASAPPPAPPAEVAAAQPRTETSAERTAGRKWVAAGRVSDLKAGCGSRVILGDRDIALFEVGGEVLAVDNRCPHRGGSLSDGTLADGWVTCPLHGWRYELRTGRADRSGAAIRTYPVRRDGDQILVGI